MIESLTQFNQLNIHLYNQGQLSSLHAVFLYIDVFSGVYQHD